MHAALANSWEIKMFFFIQYLNDEAIVIGIAFQFYSDSLCLIEISSFTWKFKCKCVTNLWNVWSHTIGQCIQSE